MIYIDFFGGLHGHFLEYTINSLVDKVKKIDPFTHLGTSHNCSLTPLATCAHYSCNKINIPDPTNVIQIQVKPDDCLLVNLLCFGRAGDHNFDLYNFEKDFAKTIRPTNYYTGFRQSLLNYGIDIANDVEVPKMVLRESLKFNFKIPENNSLYKMATKFYNVPDPLIVYVRTLYSLDTYLKLVESIIHWYNLDYQMDRLWYSELWSKFMSKNHTFGAEQYSYAILQAVESKQQLPVRMNIIQESWLDAQLENLYNIEMPAEQNEYFTSTDDINRYLGRL
jgi:hypothetical protein